MSLTIRSLKHKFDSFRDERIYQRKVAAIEKILEDRILKTMRSSKLKPLTKGQEADIKAFFKKHLGRDVPTYWHQYLYSVNGIYSVKYIPASVYSSSIIYRLNQFQFGLPYADKGFYDTLFADVSRPKTIVKSVNGFFYDAHGPISKEEALERCSNLEKAVIKPSLHGHWGNSVRVVHGENGFVPELNVDVPGLFDSYGKNFIIQERLEQHPDLVKLNPTSVNTIRVLSYRKDNEIVILYAVLRIGRLGKNVDNEKSGGIKADLDLSSGRIKGATFSSPTEELTPFTDTGVELKGYLIPSFQEVMEFVKDLHMRLPYFRLVGWDITVNAQGKPTLIEWNKSAELSQVAHGPGFGDYTEEILAEALKHPNTRFL